MPLTNEYNYSNDTYGEEPKDVIKCLICGSSYKILNGHLMMHGYTTERYRKEFNYTGSLWADSVRKKQSKNGKYRYAVDNKVREVINKGRSKGIEKAIDDAKTDEGRERLKNISKMTREEVKEWWTPKRRKERSKLQSKNKKLWWDKKKGLTK